MSGVQKIPVSADEDDARLDRWFKRRFPHVKHGMLEKMLRKGEIRVDGGRAKSSTRLAEGQEVRVPPLPDPDAPPRQNAVSAKEKAFMRSLVLFEDDRLIALNKPAGLAVQGGSKTTRHIDGMLPALGDGENAPKLTHRLDRDTSGVLVIAKTAGEAARLSKLFRSRDLKKIYWAVALGVPRPKQGEIRGRLKKAEGVGRHPDREQMTLADQDDDESQFSLTDYAVISEAAPRASWVALKPVTGRTHQLRVHMAAMGHALLGDRKYECDIPTPGGLDEQLHLHAYSLELPLADGQRMTITAPPPEHMMRTFETLGFDASIYIDPWEDERP